MRALAPGNKAVDDGAQSTRSRNRSPTPPATDPWKIKTGTSYEPFVDVFESRSLGEMNVVPGRLTGRDHHYSERKREYRYHYVLELIPNVVDIREHYPIIPIELTLDIAKQLKLAHPTHNGQPIELTFDTLLTIRHSNGELTYVARSIRDLADLAKPKVQSRLALQYAAATSRNIPWKLVTDVECSDAIATRARWLFSVYVDNPDYSCSEATTTAFLKSLSTQDFTEPLRRVLATAGLTIGLSRDEPIALFKHLVCSRMLTVDLTMPLQLKDPHVALARNFK